MKKNKQSKLFGRSKSPVDFCYLDSSPEYRLSKFERLTLTGGTELERAISWITRQLSVLVPSTSLENFKIDSVFEAARFYTAERWVTDPASFFVPPEKLPVVMETPVHGLGDGLVVDLSFPSAYRLQNSSYQKEYDQIPENHTVHVRHWRHDRDSRATLVAIHGWTMGDQRLNSLAFLPGVFYRLGLDVALIELPYHGRRKPSGKGLTNTSENLFPSSHMLRTNEGMGQVISDLRAIRMCLESAEEKPIGVIGMSLGGYIGALWASLDPLDFCIPVVPMVSMTEIAWQMLTRDPAFREFKRKGLTPELLDSIYRLHSPLTYSSKLDPGSSLIIAGIGDRIVPSRQPKQLWEHWRMPEIHWMRGGHLAHFKRSRAFLTIVHFLHRLGYANQPKI